VTSIGTVWGMVPRSANQLTPSATRSKRRTYRPARDWRNLPIDPDLGARIDVSGETTPPEVELLKPARRIQQGDAESDLPDA
jgi:hypothetical protein